METKNITELVQFETLDSTGDEQILAAVDRLNQFQKKYDGYLDAEIVKSREGDSWCIIFHYVNFEWVQAIGADLRNSEEFTGFFSLIETESLKISFGRQMKKW